jgi:hypothetical protein
MTAPILNGMKSVRMFVLITVDVIVSASRTKRLKALLSRKSSIALAWCFHFRNGGVRKVIVRAMTKMSSAMSRPEEAIPIGM